MESGHIAENLFERVNDGYGQLTVSDEGGGNGFHQIDPQPGTFFYCESREGARALDVARMGGGGLCMARSDRRSALENAPFFRQ